MRLLNFGMGIFALVLTGSPVQATIGSNCTDKCNTGYFGKYEPEEACTAPYCHSTITEEVATVPMVPDLSKWGKVNMQPGSFAEIPMYRQDGKFLIFVQCALTSSGSLYYSLELMGDWKWDWENDKTDGATTLYTGIRSHRAQLFGGHDSWVISNDMVDNFLAASPDLVSELLDSRFLSVELADPRGKSAVFVLSETSDEPAKFHRICKNLR